MPIPHNSYLDIYYLASFLRIREKNSNCSKHQKVHLKIGGIVEIEH